MKRKIRAAAAILLTLCLLTACGPADSGKEPEQPEVSAPAQEPAWGPEQPGDGAERLGFQVGDKEGLFRQVERITALWCGMLSKYGEITFTYEFAYGADYVIRRKGKLPPPEFPESQGLLFPTNYLDFHYWEGIGAHINAHFHFDDL